MDIDTTVRALPLSADSAKKIVEDIMEGHDYPGIRFMLEANLDRLRQAIKIDISIGDVITPGAVEFSYKLMFEERSISLWTYNLETLLAEKLETIMARGTANTRMRDFYDIHIILQQELIEFDVLYKAFLATSQKRKSQSLVPQLEMTLDAVEKSEAMRKDWENYKRDSFFVGELSWEDVTKSVRMLAEKVIG